MKRIIALTLAVLMVAALLCACGEKKTADTKASTPEKVTTTVEAKYDDGYAKDFAKSFTTDDNGNNVYEFDAQGYDSFVHDYGNDLASEIKTKINENKTGAYAEYVYFNEDLGAAIVGLVEGTYDAAVAATESKTVADMSFKYYKSISTPLSTVKVIYCARGNQDEIYGTFEYTAE